MNTLSKKSTLSSSVPCQVNSNRHDETRGATPITASVPIKSVAVAIDGVDSTAVSPSLEPKHTRVLRHNDLSALGGEIKPNRALEQLQALRITDAGSANQTVRTSLSTSTAVSTTAQLQRLGSEMLQKTLTKDERFVALSPQDQGLFVDVIHAMGSHKSDLRLLAHVEKRDLAGTRMLDSMHILATAPLQPGLDRQHLLRDVLNETDDIGQIDQTGSRTCSATTIQYALMNAQPAEYARLVAGLASTGRSTLASGNDLVCVANSLQASRAEDRRSSAERIFQAAIMEYANGPDWFYSDRHDVNYQPDRSGFRKKPGLSGAEIKRMSEALFGKTYDIVVFEKRNRSDAEKTPDLPDYQAIVQRLQQAPHASCIVSLRWVDAQEETWRTKKRDATWHAVNFIKTENGRVYFRNPQGSDARAANKKRSNPPRMIENESSGLESMSESEFAKRLRLVVAPNAGSI